MSTFEQVNADTRNFVKDLRAYLNTRPDILEVGPVIESGNASPGEPAWTVEVEDRGGRVFNIEVFGPYVEPS